LFFSFVFYAKAQISPNEIKHKVWDIHALRYYPFVQTADSIIRLVIARNQLAGIHPDSLSYQKTSVDLITHKQYLIDQIQSLSVTNPLLFKYFLYPYLPWMNYMQAIKDGSPDLDLTLFLSETRRNQGQKPESISKGLFEFVGSKNIAYYLDEWLGEADVLKNKSEILFLSLKSPLAKDAWKTYRYFLSSEKEINGENAYEIAFFSKDLKTNAWEGYLYISEKNLNLIKAEFTLNPFTNKGHVKEVLFTQSDGKKETVLYLGDDIKKSLMLKQTRLSKELPVFSDSLTLSQKELSGLLVEANRTRAYRNLERSLSLLLTNRIGISGRKFELGPVSQMLSYNIAEGIRLRIGGNTSPVLNKHWSLGGYLAYGTHDNQLKYRGNIAYFSKQGSSLNFTYVNDLNLPGYELLADKRDQIFYILSHSDTRIMSLQKIAQLRFEKEFTNKFSLKIGAKYWSDRPIGSLKYLIDRQGIQTEIADFSGTELSFSLRYAPQERYIRLHNERFVFRKADLDLQLNHREGIKGILGSDYHYRITDASAYKRFDFPANTGSFEIKLSGGKVWSRVPFPLLFIPTGNQSYIYEPEDYNLMNFYEFTTDRYVAGNANLQFNWSPVKFLLPKNGIRTNWGMKTIYGPLSANNDPRLQSGLFAFNHGIDALGKRPYVEMNIGFSHIFNLFRIDYVRRLTYGSRGGIFVSALIEFGK
jgi:hypothetical protein